MGVYWCGFTQLFMSFERCGCKLGMSIDVYIVISFNTLMLEPIFPPGERED